MHQKGAETAARVPYRLTVSRDVGACDVIIATVVATFTAV